MILAWVSPFKSTPTKFASLPTIYHFLRINEYIVLFWCRQRVLIQPWEMV